MELTNYSKNGIPGTIITTVGLSLCFSFTANIIINPVKVNATDMVPALLKHKYGKNLVFWGGGVDTQKTLPFGTPNQVREHVLKHCKIFGKDGGYVFNTVHDIQANTPVENVIAMFDALKELSEAFS